MFHQRPAVSPKPAPRESNTSDNHAHDRLVFLFTSFIVSSRHALIHLSTRVLTLNNLFTQGLDATVVTRSGEKFSGIFSSSSLEPTNSSFVLKMVRRLSQQDQSRATNGVSEIEAPFLGSAPDHSVAFDVKDVIDVSVANVSTADVTAKGSNGMFLILQFALFCLISSSDHCFRRIQ